MYCKITKDVLDTKVFKELISSLGLTDTQANDYAVSVIESIGTKGEVTLTEKFAEWLKANNIDSFSFNTAHKKNAKIIQDFYKNQHRAISEIEEEIHADDRRSTSVRAYGYSSIDASIKAKDHIINYWAKKIDSDRRKNNKILPEQIKYYLRQVAINSVQKEIIKRIAAKHKVAKGSQDYSDIESRVKNLDTAYITLELNDSVENRNIAALYKEMNSTIVNSETKKSDADTFFDSLFANNALSVMGVYPKDDTSDEDDTDRGTIDAELDTEINDEEDENPIIAEASDDTIAMYDHSGAKKNFTEHIDTNIKAYFMALPVFVSNEKINGKYQTIKEGLFGLAEHMDPTECINVIYTMADFTNWRTMINSIKHLSETIKGFESFAKFAEDMETDLNFAANVYNNFGKAIMSKIEVVVENSTASALRSNKRSDRRTALGFDLLNNIKATSISLSSINLASDLFSIDTKFKRTNFRTLNTSEEKEVIGEISRLFKLFYPSLDEYALTVYALNRKNADNKVDVKSNIRNLIGYLTRLNVSKDKTELEYQKLQIQINKIGHDISELRKNNGSLRKIEKLKAERKALYSIDYLDKDSKEVTAELADILAPYAAIKVDLNSRNVHGNLSSDVLNNSMLSNFMNTLKNALNNTSSEDSPLFKYGVFKFKSAQYNLSNILLETVDENNIIINKGLFKKVGDRYIPTKYATELLDVELFGGATSFDNSKNILYSEMSKNDYLTTAFLAFFNGATDDSGRYFMRIPSDAPKTYLIKAPKYSIDNLNNNGVINRNHPIFVQLRKAFTQELVDMRNAVELMFEHDSAGNVIMNPDNKGVLRPVIKEEFRHSKSNRLYKVFHYNDDIYKIASDGTTQLTGKVFTSNRLTVFDSDSNTEVNYGDELMQTIFHPFYGGAPDVVREGNNIVDIDYSQEQLDAVDKAIEQFIQTYTKEAIKRMETAKPFIKTSDKNVIDDKVFNRMVSEFVLNQHLMYINFDDLFEGNSKFYKSTQDFLKRAKESQGAGIPYSLTDYNAEFDHQGKDIIATGSILNKTEKLADIARSYGASDAVVEKITSIGQYTTFSGITVKNTKRSIPNMEENGIVARQIIAKLKNDNFSTRDAEKIANEMMKAFNNVKTNDAQSFITFEEWVRRVAARGQLYKYMPIITRIYAYEAGEIDKLDVSDLRDFIQVQKNFYYDMHFDPVTRMIVPRQIKNAEFVLIPKLVQGTQLQAVYDLMKKYDIDQLNTEETSKAGKRFILELWDNNGDIKEDIIKESQTEGKGTFGQSIDEAKEYYSYNYLYTQQETPQHIAASNKAGIQIMKKIIDNIPQGHKLYEWKEQFTNLYCEKVYRSFDSLMKELKVPRDKNGNIIVESDGSIKGLDISLFYDKIKEQFERLGSDTNASDYYTLAEDQITTDGRKVPIMPNLFNSTSNRMENIVQAIFNTSITRQKLPGFHAAQITGVGWKKLGTKAGVYTSEKLQYHPDGKPYIQIMLPKANFGLSHLSNEEALKQLQKEHLDEIIGYRIPTEGKQSICIMKVVDFIDDSYGSTIVVPDGWVAQTGSDFDIDSVYGIQHHSYIDKEGHIRKIHYRKEDGKPSDFAIDNGLIDAMFHILRDPLTIEENVSTSNFRHITEAKEDYMDDSSPVAKARDARSAYNILDQADYMEDVISGLKLKGFSVTRDSFCSICNTVRPTIIDTPFTFAYPKSQYTKEQLEKHFGNVEESSDGMYWKVTHDTFGHSLDNRNVDNNILTIYSSETTAHILDAVKEGNVPNVNDYTFGVYKNFVDVGSNYRIAVGFMLQPAVTTIVDIYNSNKSIYSRKSSNPINRALKELAIEHKLSYDKNGKIALVTPKTSLANVILSINQNEKVRSALKTILDIPTDANFIYDNGQIVLKQNGNIIDFAYSSDLLKARFKEAGVFGDSSPVKEGDTIAKLAFDIAMIIKFSQYKRFADKVTGLTRVCNPDKFGAKQSIFATSKIFDDILEAKDKKNAIFEVYDEKLKNNIPFLEAVYPGITSPSSLGNKTLIDSKYPSLFSFLKYATATSVLVNRQLFSTQSTDFVSLVKQIEKYLSNGRRLNERRYKDFEKHVLGYYYNQIPFIKFPLNYDTETHNFRPDMSEADESVEDNKVFAERQRIFGFTAGSNVNFDVVDFYNPNKDEIEAWKKLSPAQKVFWLQTNLVDSGIFARLKVDLRNSNRNKNGAQTIEFNDTTTSIEDIYTLFNQAYLKKNALIRLAIADLIKYSFVVEGFRMKQKALNKVVQNLALIESLDNGGTDIVNFMRKKIQDCSNEDLSILVDSYMRSTSSIEIGTTSDEVASIPGSKHLGSGLFYLDSEDEDLIDNNIAYRKDGDVVYNKYVRAKQKGGKTTLLCIQPANTGVYLYPLNNLEANEYSMFSANPDNFIYPSSSYYEAVIAGDEKKAAIEKAKVPAIHITKEAKQFDINKGKDEAEQRVFDQIADEIRQNADNITADAQYLMYYPVLDKYITYPDRANGSIQTIDGVSYVIYKDKRSNVVNKYLGVETKEETNLIGEVVGTKTIDKTKRSISNTDRKYANIIKDFRVRGFKEFRGSIYGVVKYVERDTSTIDNDELHSDTIEQPTANIIDIAVEASNGNAIAKATKQDLDRLGITDDSQVVKAHLADTYKIMSEYVTKTVQTLSDLATSFADGKGINSAEAIKLIKNNKEERLKFLRICLDAKKLIKQYSNYTTIPYENEEIKLYLDNIKEKIGRLQTDVFATAYDRFATEYLKSISTNPLVQQDVISLMDGFYSSGLIEALINDTQEMPNPLVQVITKNVMADIRSREGQALDDIRTFEAKIADIKKRAKEAGFEINWDNLIDSQGNFIAAYSDKFYSDYAELKKQLDAAELNGRGSIEYLKARLELDKWLRDNTEQPYASGYTDEFGIYHEGFYDKKIKLEEAMIVNHAAIYSLYQTLKEERKQEASHIQGGMLDEAHAKRVQEIDRQLQALDSPVVYNADGTFIVKPSKREAPDINPVDTKDEANALRQYKKDLAALYDEYSESQEYATFRDNLRRNLDIVNRWEARDSENRLTRNPIDLYNIPEYAEAKQWIRNNAKFVVTEDVAKQINEAFNILKLGKNSNASVAFRDMARTIKDLYDIYGVVDGTKLTAEQQKRIMKAQEDDAKAAAVNLGNNSTLINSAAPNPEVYTSKFYAKLFGNLSKNPIYISLVEDVNNILRPHYDTVSKRIIWSEVTKDEYESLATLYKSLREIKQHSDESRVFMTKFTEWFIDENSFTIAKAAALMNPAIDMDLWNAVNTEVIEENGETKVIPNRLIYGYQVPNEKCRNIKDKKGNVVYVDLDKTAARKTIKNFCTTEPTQYYYKELERRRNIQGAAEDGRTFEEWYADNHYWNPLSHTMTPIKCWMHSVIDNGNGTWEATFNQAHSVPKAEYKNPNYKEGLSLGMHYNGSEKYKKSVDVNPYEQELKDYIQGLLISLSKNNESARKFFEAGHLPVMSKDAEHDTKYYMKELAKMTGWIEGTDGVGRFDRDISYANDMVTNMPMTTLLKQLRPDRKELVKPTKEAYPDEGDYEKALDDYEKDKEALEKEDKEFTEKMLNRNWEDVIKLFIKRAAHYNAVQDNKLILYYALEQLARQRNYIEYVGQDGLEEDKRGIIDKTRKRYQTQAAQEEYEQLANWMRRLIFDQWRKPNKKFTKIASVIQSFTSANFMMLNVRGGIANVTLGESQIQGEAWAGDYINWSEYAEGKAIWLSNVTNMAANVYEDTATSVADAYIKFMEVIDYDQIRGVVDVPTDPALYITRLRNFMFSPQTIGEHFMQNSVLFAMSKSNKLYQATDDNGNTKWVLKGRPEVIRDAHRQAMLEILDDRRNEYFEFEKEQLKDANSKKDYAQFRKDLTTEFLLSKLDSNDRDRFIKRKKELEEEALEEFKNAPDVYSQLDLGSDGKLTFKDGSILQSINVKEEGEDASQAHRLLAELKGKVISVNKKIHGNYGRLDSAKIEAEWWGPLVMQYHKHIVPGFLRRWRRHGYYNEERGTVEKGSIIALYDFLAIPFKKKSRKYNLTDAEIETMQATQNMLSSVVDFVTHISTYWNLLPTYEKNNIARNLGSVCGVLSALFIAIALRAMGDDDEEGRLYNLALYEADRLASETMQFNPLGFTSEAKKLWSNPVAVQSIFNDILSSAGTLSQMIMEGEDYDPYYHSGKYAGEHKLKVYVERRIPIWRGVKSILDIADDNHYYKLGDNMLSIVPVKHIADWISK